MLMGTITVTHRLGTDGPYSIRLSTSSYTTTGTSPTPPAGATQPHRFYGSVEIDMVRPVKSFDAILNSVVMELQRTQGAKVKLMLDIEATAPTRFSDADAEVVRDNARQLKFKADSTGFED
jgi:hypothetical protein